MTNFSERIPIVTQRKAVYAAVVLQMLHLVSHGFWASTLHNEMA